MRKLHWTTAAGFVVTNVQVGMLDYQWFRLTERASCSGGRPASFIRIGGVGCGGFGGRVGQMGGRVAWIEGQKIGR